MRGLARLARPRLTIEPTPSGRRPSALLLTLVVAGLLGMAALQYVAQRSAATVASQVATPVLYQVGTGTLGRSLRLTAVARWRVDRTLFAPASGIVTEITARSGVLSEGAVLLRVDERPMLALRSSVPAFRTMSEGMRGRDVRALQDYLARIGYRVAADRDRFTSMTQEAVRAWQTDLGLDATGSVQFGDVLFIEPAAFGRPFRIAEGVEAGGLLASGAMLLEGLADAPSLSIEFAGSPPPQVERGLDGAVTFPGGEQRTVRLTSFETRQDRQIATLQALDDLLCQPGECLSLVSAIGSSSLSVTFTLVPSTTGPMIPATAIQTDAADGSFVLLADLSRRPVRVIVADGGLAIVDGLTVGESITLP